MKISGYILLSLLVLFQPDFAEAQKKNRKKDKKESRAQQAEYAFTEGMKAYVLGKFPDALEHFETSQKLGGDNAALDFMFAQIYIQRDKADLALQYAEKALKADSKNKYYYLIVASIYEAKKNYSEAVKIYQKLISEVPKSEEYYYEIGDILYYQRHYEEALKAYDKIDEYFGKSVAVTQRKQDIYLKLGNTPKAIEEGESLIKSNPDESEFKISQAQFYFKNKMPDKAAPILEDVLKHEPENPDARILLSDIYQMQGNKEKSEKELEAIFNNPDVDINVKLNIIGGYLKAADTEYNRNKALSLSEAAAKMHPTEARVFAIYGEALRRAGKKEEAWQNFIKSKNLDNSNFAVWTELLAFDADMNKPDSLVKHSDEALESFPNQAIFWMYQGIGYSLKKNYTQATESFEEGRKLSGDNAALKVQFSIHLGDNYNYIKDFSKSDAAYDNALKLDPDNDHVLNNYSYFLSLRNEKLDQAKSMSGKLVEKYPDNPTYLDTYAWVLYQMKDYENAKKVLEKAVTKSENGTIVEHYGDVLFKLGKTDQALEQWKKAKTLGETSDLIDKKIADKKLYE